MWMVWSLPRMIGDVIRDGSALSVPVLAGYNADEGTLFYDPALAKPTVLHRPGLSLKSILSVWPCSNRFTAHRTRPA